MWTFLYNKAKAFIINVIGFVVGLANTLKDLFVVPLHPADLPFWFYVPRGTRMVRWEEKARRMGTIQIKKFNNDSKMALYYNFYSLLGEKVLTIAVFQRDINIAETESFLYIRNPETRVTVANRFMKTTFDLHRFWEQFSEAINYHKLKFLDGRRSN